MIWYSFLVFFNTDSNRRNGTWGDKFRKPKFYFFLLKQQITKKKKKKMESFSFPYLSSDFCSINSSGKEFGEGIYNQENEEKGFLVLVLFQNPKQIFSGKERENTTISHFLFLFYFLFQRVEKRKWSSEATLAAIALENESWIGK